MAGEQLLLHLVNQPNSLRLKKMNLRLVGFVVLILAAVGCDNPSAPVPTYTLVSINGAALPARLWPGSGPFCSESVFDALVQWDGAVARSIPV